MGLGMQQLEEKKGVVVEEEVETRIIMEEQMGKGEREDKDMTAMLAAFPEYRAIMLETQVGYILRKKNQNKTKKANHVAKTAIAQVALMSGPGALPLPHRHYVALLACSALKCPNLAKTQVSIKCQLRLF